MKKEKDLNLVNNCVYIGYFLIFTPRYRVCNKKSSLYLYIIFCIMIFNVSLFIYKKSHKKNKFKITFSYVCDVFIIYAINN
ncbi:hypothetical protein JI57_01325 [Psychromonas sp. PRT-SC03]|nr:hypothetical protein JI57_01325 [Psychromonas sp. PRT-SC03]